MAVLAAWAILRLVARVVAAVVVVGLLLYGLAMLVGSWTDRSPEAVIRSTIATIAAEATRAARDLAAPEDLGRLDRPRATPATLPDEEQPATRP